MSSVFAITLTTSAHIALYWFCAGSLFFLVALFLSTTDMPQPLAMLSRFLIGVLIEKVVKMSVLRTSPSHADKLFFTTSAA